ncbi:hypothetical protein FHW88_001535 [Mucilaginibacter sp. SG538B]|nr:hypothetical protein [Mucilaginibacter sp. SG538B]
MPKQGINQSYDNQNSLFIIFRINTRDFVSTAPAPHPIVFVVQGK